MSSQRTSRRIGAVVTRATVLAVLLSGLLAFAPVAPGAQQGASDGTVAPAAAGATLPPVPARLTCAELAGREFEATPGDTGRILWTEVVAATATVAEYCRVSGFISPQHLFEMRLPTTRWTQRMLQIGCGGFCGTPATLQAVSAAGCIPYQSGEMVLVQGNGGHVGATVTDGSWAVDRSLVEDSAYESEHQLSLVAKAVVGEFYRQAPAYSYFSSCSNGGRQALMLAQRYPTDFDGIIAGAPANILMPLVVFSLGWNVRANTAADGTELVKAADLPVLHAGALAACDGLDGLVDGLITDPLDCRFDPAAVQCAGGGPAPGCLSAAQVEAARKIYQGAIDENGEPFYPGGMPVGSELAWAGWIVRPAATPASPAASELFSRQWLRYQPSPDPAVSYDLDDISFDSALDEELSWADTIGAATDPDLRAFRDAGGKLIIWHGWNDPAIPAQGAIAYYNAVTEAMGGPEAAGQFARLYLVPGMYHCVGGDGPSVFDTLTPMLNWVEDGTAPERIVAAQLGQGGAVVRTRPVFPYPQVPVWNGTGDPNVEASFGPGPGGEHDIAWRGAFTPGGGRQWCRYENGQLICGPDRGAN